MYHYQTFILILCCISSDVAFYNYFIPQNYTKYYSKLLIYYMKYLKTKLINSHLTLTAVMNE